MDFPEFDDYLGAHRKLPVTTVVLEKIKFTVAQQVGQHLLNSMEVDAVEDIISGNIAYHLRVDLLGREMRSDLTDSEYVPRDWWEHVKERFAPQWFLRRWPVKGRYIMTTTRHFRICPHLNTASHADHISFFTCP